MISCGCDLFLLSTDNKDDEVSDNDDTNDNADDDFPGWLFPFS